MESYLVITKRTISLFILSLSVPCMLLSQPTISASDFLGQIGTIQVVVDDKSFSIPIDVGSPGANQVWDFRTQAIGDSLFSVHEYLSPSALTNPFPMANWVQKIYDPANPTFELFKFYNVSANLLINLGDSSHVDTPFDTTFISSQNDTLAPLPIAFNNTWMTYEHDTTGFYPVTANISTDTTENFIDAWGTVRLPLGDFECLRLRQNVKVINQTIFNGVVLSTHTDTYIQYDWIATDLFTVARAQSQNGNSDPNFTDAQGFGRLDSISPATGVDKDELAQIPSGFGLLQNYPNPFNPSTTVSFMLHQSSDVVVNIFNNKGQLVRTLANGKFSAGNHSVVWDGRDDFASVVPSGLYVSRLSAGEFADQRKMLFIK